MISCNHASTRSTISKGSAVTSHAGKPVNRRLVLWSRAVAALVFVTIPVALSACGSRQAEPAGTTQGSSNGAVWTSVGPLDKSQPSTITTSALSCPTAGFCMAATEGGEPYAWVPGGWQSLEGDAAGSDVSCPSPSFCMAVNPSTVTAQIYEPSQGNTSWQDASVTSSETANPSVVSCPSSSFCMAADGNGGGAYSWNDGYWPTAQVVDQIQGDQDGFTSMSCPTTSFCAAGAQLGYIYIYSNGLWDPGVQIDSSSPAGLGLGLVHPRL